MDLSLCPQGQAGAIQCTVSDTQVLWRHGINSCFAKATTVGTIPSFPIKANYFKCGRTLWLEQIDDLFCELKTPLIVTRLVNVCGYLIKRKNSLRMKRWTQACTEKEYEEHTSLPGAIPMKPNTLSRSQTLSTHPGQHVAKALRVSNQVAGNLEN